MSLQKQLSSWTLKLPSRWGLGHTEIHSSLLITLGSLSLLMLVVGASTPGRHEFQNAALTLPIVWLVSLAVRLAAQQFAIGGYANAVQTIVGPTGNLSTDYETLPLGRIYTYALASQLATFALLLLGAIINSATSMVPTNELTWSEILDFKCGWDSRSWATQITYVNLFIGLINFLPTVPFDTRAAVFGYVARRNRTMSESSVFRSIASLDTHLAAGLLGMGSTIFLVSLWLGQELFGWHAVIAASVYMFVASRWELSRSADLESQFTTLSRPIHRQDKVSSTAPHVTFGDSAPNRVSSADLMTNKSAEYFREEDPHPHDEAILDVSDIDIDEVLRKLHRDGRQALSALENEALLSASRQLQKKRERSGSN